MTVVGLPSARQVAEAVTDPELPALTLADLGVLRDVTTTAGGKVTVTITPTYTGCPAMDAMRADLIGALGAAGFADVEVTMVLDPSWSTDWITAQGRRRLAEAGIAPPLPAPPRGEGPIPIRLTPLPSRVPCPRCGSASTEETSHFGSTACKALRRCRSCGEPFEHVKAR